MSIEQQIKKGKPLQANGDIGVFCSLIRYVICKYFSHSMGCCLTLLIVCFDVQKFLILTSGQIRSDLSLSHVRLLATP